MKLGRGNSLPKKIKSDVSSMHAEEVGLHAMVI